MFNILKSQITRVVEIAILSISYFMWYLVEYQSKDPLTALIPLPDDRKCIYDLKKHFDEIRDEIISNIDCATPFECDPYFQADITDDQKWKKIYLKWYASSPDYAYRMFPRLMDVVDSNPDIRLAMVSKLEPGAVIKPHAGLYRGSLRVHMGILTPNNPNCFIWIDEKQYFWKDRELVTFDDTYPHYVKNNTKEDRIVLFLDVDRQMKSRWSQIILNLISTYIVPIVSPLKESL